jgi:DNA-binding response OmpR family regulator
MKGTAPPTVQGCRAMKRRVANPRTILLLTTDPRVVCVVRDAAVQKGYELRLLQDPIEAYYQIRGESSGIDLVLLDLDPGMQAVALLSVTLDRVPVVVLTSIPSARLAELFRHRGVQHSVTKPLSTLRLIEAIEHSLAPAAEAV